MTVTVITGKPGAGKNLYALAEIERYARDGRRIVANFNVDLEPLLGWWERVILKRTAPHIERIPGRPTYEDIVQLGKGGPREHRAGLLVLDEVGPLLNSRSWQERSRNSVIDWLLHHRKLAWDVLMIVQNVALLDKQIRVAVVEMCVTVKRLDKIRWLGVPLPRIHVAWERYGVEPNAPRSRMRAFRGSRYYAAYDTTELVAGELAEAAGAAGSAAPEPPHSTQHTYAGRVPRGIRTVKFPRPDCALAEFFRDASMELGVARTDLPPGYFERLAAKARGA